MRAQSIELLIEQIMNQYNEKTEGWKVLIDRKGNVLVIGPRIGYRLKLIPLNPEEYTGVGVRISGLKEMQRITEGLPSYGFRPLSSTETKHLLNTIHKGGTVQSKLIEKLLETKPVPTWELPKKEHRAVLTGPVMARPSLSAISKSQRELERKLALEADKLFRKKYPLRAAIYG